MSYIIQFCYIRDACQNLAPYFMQSSS